MRHTRLLLYFALALSGLVFAGSSAGAAWNPMTCFSQRETIGIGQTFPGTTFVCWGATCTCTVTTCPRLCRLTEGVVNRQCTFVSHCTFGTVPKVGG